MMHTKSQIGIRYRRFSGTATRKQHQRPNRGRHNTKGGMRPAGAGGKTYYLTADSTSLMEEWVRVLQNVIQRNALKLLLSSEDQKPTASGWLSKVKNGHAKRVWCVLIGKMFIYFKTPGDQVS